VYLLPNYLRRNTDKNSSLITKKHVKILAEHKYLNAVMKATQYLCSVSSVKRVVHCWRRRQMHIFISTIGRGYWIRRWRALGGCGKWVITAVSS